VYDKINKVIAAGADQDGMGWGGGIVSRSQTTFSSFVGKKKTQCKRLQKKRSGCARLGGEGFGF